MSTVSEILEAARALSPEEQRRLASTLLQGETAREVPDQPSTSHDSDDVLIISENMDWGELSADERNASLPDLRLRLEARRKKRTKKRRSRSTEMKRRLCYNCRQPGHKIELCTARPHIRSTIQRMSNLTISIVNDR